MADRIEPALSAEEWAEFLDKSRWHGDRVEGRTLFVASDCGGEPYAEDVELDAHETAAKCLHGQPFGFTHEDVRRHREQAALLRDMEIEVESQGDQQTDGENAEFIRQQHERWIREAAWHESMAERLAALLPPEETARG